MERTFVTSSDDQTKEIAINLINSLEAGVTICLIGEMAAGKTTFSQGIGQALNLSRIVSPTYMIMREYKVEGHKFLKRLFHLDLYRLHSVEEIKSFDLEEVWSDPSHLVVIEWPEKIIPLLPSKHINVHIKSTGENQREIKIKQT